METKLAFRIAGKIEARLVDRGSRVRAGQALAILDRTDLSVQLQQAQAALASARAVHDQAVTDQRRVLSLRGRGWSTDADRDRAAATVDQTGGALKQAEQGVALARNALSYSTLTADADGIVTAVLAEAGQVVSAGTPVLSLARTDTLEADVSVPENLAGRLADGVATVSTWSDPKRAYPAKLRELTPTADDMSRTYPARFSMEGQGAEVQMGMTAAVTWSVPEEPIARLPITSLLDEGKGPTVLVVERGSGQLVQKPVAVKGYEAQWALVSSGVAQGDAVVSVGVQKLHAGDKVRVVDAGS